MATDLTAARSAYDTALARVQDVTTIEYLKLGTEDEALDFDEIRYLREVSPRDVGIAVKIGGPCACADIRQAGFVGAMGLVAPMVESPYALRSYIKSTELVLGEEAAGRMLRGFNLETISAYERLGDLLAEPAAKKLSFVNVGRSDLSASFGTVVADPKIRDVTVDIARRVSAAGLPIHVGGKVTRETLGPVLERIDLDGVHTRFMSFSTPTLDAIETTVRTVLEFEIELLRLLGTRFAHRAGEHLARAEETARRLAG